MKLSKKISISIVLILAVCAISIYTVGSVNKRQTAMRSCPMQVNLYFANDQARLVAEKRTLFTDENMLRACVEQLIAGPRDGSLTPVLPKDAVVKSVKIKDGVAYVDFDKRLAAQLKSGSQSELLAVYSIVNTLTAQENVKEVMILIDGEKAETLTGQIDLSQPLKRRDL